MIVAGGSYLEHCRYPYWSRLFGSGLRAALALQNISPQTELFTYAPPSYAEDVLASLYGAGLKGQVSPATTSMRFEWLHPFQLESYPDSRMEQLPDIEITAPCVLRFGMLEGSARVKAQRVVYSLQNETEGFFKNGSRADEMVMVVSERELTRMLPGAATGVDRIAQLLDLPDYEKLKRFAVLLRNEVGDVMLHQRGGGTIKLVTYASESYFKIGAGDVLAAGFAHAWMEEGLSLEEAADRGARSLAWFVQDGRLPLPEAAALPTRPQGDFPDRVRILGSDTIEMGQLVVATADWLEGLGIDLTVELDGQSTEAYSAAPTLVLIGSRTSPSEILELADSSATAPLRIVFATKAAWLDGYFPGAILVEDYASALHHLLRTTL